MSLKQIYNSALEAGILPHLLWDMTFAEASACVSGIKLRDNIAWNHTASILSMIANVNRSSSSKSYKPQDFHPYNSNGSVSTDKEETKNLVKSMRNAFNSKHNSRSNT